MQDLVADLLGLFGEKVVRRAVKLLEDRCFIESRGNPRDPRDRTRQFRLRYEAMEVALTDIPSNCGLEGEKMPNAKGKNAELIESTTGPDRKWQEDRMQTVKKPSLLGREITDSERSSSSLAGGVVVETKTRTNYTVQDGIMEWIKAENLRRMRDDGGFGPPAASQVTRWAAILTDLGLSEESDVRAVMAAARAGAEKASGGEWRQWSFLSLQVQLAVERYRLALNKQPEARTEVEWVAERAPRTGSEPSREELAAELEELRGALKRSNDERDRCCWERPYADTGSLDTQIRSLQSRIACVLARLRVSASTKAITGDA
jgi:hypothetical protein